MKPPAHRRPSSYSMQPAELVFAELALAPGEVLVDLGCGAGEYALHAARLVGATGLVYALDRSAELVDDLERRAAAEGAANLRPIAADILEPLPLEDGCADVCLAATVLHAPGVADHAEALCAEIRRVLRPRGRLAVIECGTRDLSFGPPPHLRLSPARLEELVSPHGFVATREIDLGFNYLVQFAPVAAQRDRAGA